MPTVNENKREDLKSIDLSKLDTNDKIMIDLTAKQSSDFSIESWVGFGVSLDSVDGSTILSKKSLQIAANELKKSGKNAGGIYGFSKYILDPDSVLVSKTDDGKYLIEKEVVVKGEVKQLIGIFDRENKNFASAEAVISAGKVDYIPIENLEAAKSLIYSALIAERIDSSRPVAKQHKLLMDKYYDSEKKMPVNSASQESVNNFVESLSAIGRSVYDEYFAYNSVRDDAGKNIGKELKEFSFDNINLNLTKDIIDSLPRSTAIYGNKKANYLPDIEVKVTINNNPRTIKECLDLYDINFYDAAGQRLPQDKIDEYKKSPEYQLKLDNLAARSDVFPDWAIDLSRMIFFHTINNRRAASQGRNITPFRFCLVSPPGTGKSYNCETMSLIASMFYSTINCNANTTAQDLGYREAIINGTSVKIPSPAIVTFADGGLCILDEFPNIQRPEVINEITEAIKQGYYKTEDGQRMKIHTDTAIGFVGNLGVAGTREMSPRIMDSIDYYVFIPPYNSDEMYKISMHQTNDHFDVIEPDLLSVIDRDEWNEALYSLCKIIDIINTGVYESSKTLPVKQRNKQAYIDIRHLPGFLADVLDAAELRYYEEGTLGWKDVYLELLTKQEDNPLFSKTQTPQIKELINKLIGLVKTQGLDSGVTLEQFLRSSSSYQESSVFGSN